MNARPIKAGMTYMVTRRCSERRFFLHPCALTNQVFIYILALVAPLFGILIHACVVMSDHWHAVVTDTTGDLPGFLGQVHRLVARCINTSLGRTQNLWDCRKVSIQPLVHADDIIAAMAYVMANPVAAGLVESPADWPGLVSIKIGQRFEATRPEVYFRRNGRMPLRASFQITRPPLLDHLSDEELQTRLDLAVEARVQAKLSKFALEGRPVAGVEKVLGTPPSKTASTREPIMGRIPKYFSVSRERLELLIAEGKAWLRLYKAALKDWCEGKRRVVFPDGTYYLFRFHGAFREMGLRGTTAMALSWPS